MNIVHTIRRWRTIKRTEAELHKLRDRELQDTGISRSNIGEFARGAYHDFS